jgi:hypothetical protein
VVVQVKTLVELAMSSHVEHKVAASVLGSKYVRLDPDDGVADVNLIEDNTVGGCVYCRCSHKCMCCARYAVRVFTCDCA